MKRLLEERLPLLPPFRWRLAEVPFGLDYPYWVDDQDFDLDFHVRELALPAPGSDEQLAEQVARIFARPLDRARPLWELYVIHGLRIGHVAALTKIHHALIDGLSGAEIMGLLLDLEPTGRELPPRAGAASPRRSRATSRCSAAACSGCRATRCARSGRCRGRCRTWRTRPFGTLPGATSLGRLAARARGVVTGDGAGPGTSLRAPKTSFNGRVSPHRRFAFGQLALDDVKAAKNAHGCTVNDVVVSICAGVVRRWLIEHDELPDEPLVAQIPVSVRTTEQTGTYGNRIMLMSAPLFTNVEDPVERLHAHPRRDGRHEAAPQGAAGGAAPGREPLHPAGRLLTRGARHLPAGDVGVPAARRGTSSSRTCLARSSRSTWRGPSCRRTTPCPSSPTGWG